MILKNDTDTRDLHWGKYDSPMAVYLENLWLDGDQGIDWIGSVDELGHYAQYGRRVMVSDDLGFVSVLTFPDQGSADDFMEHMYHAYAVYDDGEE